MAVFPFSADLLSHTMLALYFACFILIFTIGLNMVYSVLKFSNFAHAEFITFGMFIAWWALQILTFSFAWDTDHWINNIFVHASISFLMVGLLGILFELLVYRRLRNIRANATSLTVASIGLGLVVRNFITMIFGENPQANKVLCSHCTNQVSFPNILPEILRRDIYRFQLTNSKLWGVQSFSLTVFEVYTIIVALIVVFAVDYLFRKTKTGIAMRATSDSFELAQVSGINTNKIVLFTWFLAAGITGIGAAFYRPNIVKLTSLEGFFLLLFIFAVAILGGVGSFRGGIVAAFIIAFTKQIAVIILSELQKPGGFWLNELFGINDRSIEDILNIITFAPSYAPGVAFLVLILVLLFRPQGIYGNVDATRARV